MSDKEEEDVEAWLNKGNALLNLNKPEEALDACNKAIEIEPENADAWYVKAEALFKLNKPKETLDACNRVIEIEPEDAGAWINKGNILGDLQRSESALMAFNVAIEIEPENASAFYGKGIVLINLKKYEDALDAYDKAIDINPAYAEAWINKGVILFDLKKYKDALEAFEKAIYVEPEMALAWLNKGNALLNLNKYRAALNAYNKAIEIDPKYSKAWVYKGTTLHFLEIYNHALEAYEKAIEIDPKSEEAWIGKGVVLYSIKRYKEALESLEKSVNINPDLAYTHNILGDYYLSFGDLKNASKYIESALLIEKENALSLGLKGKIKIEEQDYHASSIYFQRAIPFDLRNPVYLLWDSYAKYLMAELEFSSDEKKYQDMLLAIIRELEKVDKCNSIGCNNKLNKFLCWLLKLSPNWFKNLATYLLKFTKRVLIFLDINEELTVILLEVINPFLKKLESTKIIAYNYYFLGCFYYKINDYFTAIEYLKKCTNLNPDSTIRKSSCEILNSIWNSKVRPSVWSWWLNSPLHTWFRRISFVVLVFSLFGILLSLHESSIYISSFFSSLSWEENTTQLTFLTLIIIYILVSPNIQHFKSNQIEIEIHPPTAFELTPSLIEKKLKDLESISSWSYTLEK